MANVGPRPNLQSRDRTGVALKIVMLDVRSRDAQVLH